MTSILKVLLLAMSLVVGSVAAIGSALAGTDVTYHWGYPDNLKAQPNIPVQSLGGSGLPPLYR
jgi:hypothetical protein